VSSKPGAGQADLIHPGWNFIVAEIENSQFGGCSMRIDITVNGKQLENFPRVFPSNTFLEGSAVNRDRVATLEKSGRWPMSNVLCARRIFAFYVSE
jgi:hypothetical protein